METYQPRTISLACELFHPPVQPDPRPLQKLHNELFEAGDPPYASYSVTPLGVALSNPQTGPQHVSQALFLADRMQFREDLGSLTHEDFAQRVARVAERAAPLRGVQQILAQQVTVRSLINPVHFRDSRRFVQEAVLDLDDQLEAFPTAPLLLGLRLAFPASSEGGGAYNVRIESWTQDARSLYIEVQGGFAGMVALGALDGVAERVQEAYDFLQHHVLDFVRRFDMSGAS